VRLLLPHHRDGRIVLEAFAEEIVSGSHGSACVMDFVHASDRLRPVLLDCAARS
jgi:hypothetical protein